jgi:hypothetical protein
MIIATNKAQFVNPANAATGTLRAYGSHALAANDAFLAFKPAALCKNNGYLSINGSGYIANSWQTIKVYMEFSKPGVDTFWAHILDINASDAGTAPGVPYFSFQVDIPVGTTSHSEVNTILTTSHFNSITRLLQSWAYINAEPDDVWFAAFKYVLTNDSQPVLAGTIKINSVIAEYKEN